MKIPVERHDHARMPKATPGGRPHCHDHAMIVTRIDCVCDPRLSTQWFLANCGCVLLYVTVASIRGTHPLSATNTLKGALSPMLLTISLFGWVGMWMDEHVDG